MDVYSAGTRRHHVSALLEIDVTGSREMLRKAKREGTKVSFTGWIIKVIADAIGDHPQVAAYLVNKKKMVTFPDINVSTMVEKEVEGNKVPLAMVIEKAHEKNVVDITAELTRAIERQTSSEEWVLGKPPDWRMSLYTLLPGPLRRALWRWMQHHPHTAFQQMGNVMVTSLSMLGRTRGWFIHRTIHPVSFGIGAVSRKPWAVGNEVVVRDILQMTVLLDHDVIDGAPMVRFINDLVQRIECGYGINTFS
jgi:pyruvate/2-oxoglutarate dehydrogenase complex dihydrolipoamide acyltransferase (E2) component